MRTLIVGRGIIGTIYGWALAEAGIDVTHYLRPVYGTSGVTEVSLDVLDERKGHKPNNQTTYSMRWVTSIRPEDHYELIILPVNTDQLEAALAELAPAAGDAVFLPMTSNWEGTGMLDAYLPQDRYLLGYADGGGTLRNGTYWANIGAEIHIGDPNGTNAGNLSRVKTLFEQADMQPDVQSNILQWLWAHNASTVGFAAGFARYQDIQSFLKDSETLKTSLDATRELFTLCERRGVDLKKIPELSYMNWPNWLVMALTCWLYTTNKSMQRYTAHAASAGSLRETKMNYGAMLRSADEMGLATPALHSLGIYLESK
jgi:2-dehydropantoate 2-reductase